MSETQSRGLGRLRKPDPRDHLFLLTPPAKPRRRKRAWSPGRGHAWDQGNTSRCCSFGTNRWLIASPVKNKIWPGGLDEFYDRIRAVDGFAPPDHDGSTVRACFEVLRAAGYVGGYRWGFDAKTVVNQILTEGPVVAGIDWTEPMFDPAPYGNPGAMFVEIDPTHSGRYDVAGGHCVLLDAVDLDGPCPDGSTGWVEIFNSWGRGWGHEGRSRLSIRDLGILCNNGGEFAVATELTPLPAATAAAA
jgi:hypothetical protein